ncbi:hypothetical protein MMC07_003269, partial [Pseudocyphellaria aurata]|nr:hypothetical protein [Pseudocyphellaria aurata]
MRVILCQEQPRRRSGRGRRLVGSDGESQAHQQISREVHGPRGQRLAIHGQCKGVGDSKVTVRYEFLESHDNAIKTPLPGIDRLASRINQSGMPGRLDRNKPEIPERGPSG